MNGPRSRVCDGSATAWRRWIEWGGSSLRRAALAFACVLATANGSLAQQAVHKFEEVTGLAQVEKTLPAGLELVSIVKADGAGLLKKLRRAARNKRPVTLQFPRRPNVIFQVEEAEKTPFGGWIFEGFVNGQKQNTGRLLVADDGVAELVYVGNTKIFIEPVDDLLSEIIEAKASYYPPEFEPPEDSGIQPDSNDVDDVEFIEKKTYPNKITIDRPKGIGYFDLLVLVANGAKKNSRHQELIHLGIKDLHFALVYGNSTKTVRYSYQYVNINESAFSFEALLSKISNSSDVRERRIKRKADLVTLVVESSNICGYGNYNASPKNSTKHRAFSVVSISPSCILDNFSLAHEIGHNLGLRHSRWDVKKAGDSSYKNSSTFNFGYSNLKGKVRDLMAYNGECLAKGFSCRRLPRFSNPAFKHAGKYPLGVKASDGLPANGAKRMLQTIGSVANYY